MLVGVVSLSTVYVGMISLGGCGQSWWVWLVWVKLLRGDTTFNLSVVCFCVVVVYTVSSEVKKLPLSALVQVVQIFYSQCTDLKRLRQMMYGEGNKICIR